MPPDQAESSGQAQTFTQVNNSLSMKRIIKNVLVHLYVNILVSEFPGLKLNIYIRYYPFSKPNA